MDGGVDGAVESLEGELGLVVVVVIVVGMISTYRVGL